VPGATSKDGNATAPRSRTTAAIASWMVLVDAGAALLPSDPGRAAGSAIVVRGAGLLSVLSDCFEQSWSHAAELCDTAPVEPTGLRPEQVSLLRLLADG